MEGFFEMFNKNYEDALSRDFSSMSMQEQIAFVKHLFKVSCSSIHVVYSNHQALERDACKFGLTHIHVFCQ